MIGVHKIKKKSLSFVILKTLAVSGVFVLAASNPRFAVNLPKNISRILKELDGKKKREKLFRALSYLRSRKFTEIKDLPDGKSEIKITSAGQEFIGVADFDNLEIEKPAIWDKKFRLVIFDIPKHKHSASTSFSRKLKEMGFLMIQKSIWAHPYDCLNEIVYLRNIFEIEPYVKVVLAEAIEGDFKIRRHFKLV
ncbi:MAG: hypothetical protein Q8R55_07170 [Candidatus Taylorbacteria bacterium]|nr:hypothetical protein [Candidatus Taylorbacteria bacterium]